MNRVSRSVIDITFVRGFPPLRVCNWRVLEDNSVSDHKYISFKITTDRPRVVGDHRPAVLPGWSTRKLDVTALDSFLALEPNPYGIGDGSALRMATSLGNYLAEACGICMPRRSLPPRRRSVHWWNEEIAQLRHQCITARRKFQRSARRWQPELTNSLRLEHQAVRKALRVAIRKSQAKSWSDLCRLVDTDPWGLPYKVVTRRGGGT